MRGFSLWAGTAMSLLIVWSVAVPAVADVTGSLGTRVSVTTKQTPHKEVNPLLFDIENDLNLSVAFDGFTSNLHTHFGLAGIEDIILNFQATLGLLELTSQAAWARFEAGVRVPFYDDPHLIQQTFQARMPFSGFELSHLTIIEDTAAFDDQSSAYAFGSVITLAGETDSGIALENKVGICTERSSLTIKKHVLSPFSINSSCAQEPKPDLLFDFAQLSIRGITLAQGVQVEALIHCEWTTACSLTQTLALRNGIVPISADLRFQDMTTLALDQIDINLKPDWGQLRVSLQPNARLSLSSIRTALRLSEAPSTVNLKLNVRFKDSVSGHPANGSAILTVRNENITTSLATLFTPTNGALRLSTITLRTVTELNAVELDGSISYATDAMISGKIGALIRF